MGPLQLEGVPYPITQENVIEYMRQSKVPPPGATENWYRKEFIGKLGAALLAELSSGSGRDWRALGGLFVRALAERHLLLQLDDPVVTGFLAERGWDNAVRPGDGDYFMSVDTNIGFNKTNAVVETRLAYDVDLSDLSSPRATLTVVHQNNASKAVPCRPMAGTPAFEAESWYPVNRCYWNYLRIYKQEGARLLEANPQAILGGWLVGGGENLPPQVDELDEEIPGVRTFGTLQVVHGGSSLSTSFAFALPSGVVVLEDDTGVRSYRLNVQKQPGTGAIPLTIRIHLPARAALESVSGQALWQDHSLLLETDLRTDVEFEVRFLLP
jgi:hypothetical protein